MFDRASFASGMTGAEITATLGLTGIATYQVRPLVLDVKHSDVTMLLLAPEPGP